MTAAYDLFGYREPVCCATCGLIFFAAQTRVRNGWGLYCRPECRPAKRGPSGRTNTMDDVWARVQKGPGCWIWTGTISGNGYGTIKLRGRQCLPHRLVFEALRGPIPHGLVLDHLCRTPRCVNPDHLEPVTDRVNILRGVGPCAVNAAKTECSCGAPFSRTPRGVRICKSCKRIDTRLRQRRRRAERRNEEEAPDAQG